MHLKYGRTGKLIHFSVFLVCCAFAWPQSADLLEKSRRSKEAMASQRYDEAAAIYTEMARSLPNDPGILLNLGLAYSMAGRSRQAIPPLEAALKLKPDLVPALLFLGASYLDVGRTEAAIAPLQKVLSADPGNVHARHMLADALQSLEQYETAVTHLTALAKTNPENPKVWFGLGRCYEALCNRAFRRIEKLDPESPYIPLILAQALAQQKRYSNAFYLYRQAQEKLPDSRAIHEALADIYRRTDHPDWAVQEEKKAQALPLPDCRSPSLECSFLAGRYLDVIGAAKTSETPAAYYWVARAYNSLAFESFSRLGRLPPSMEMHEVVAETHSTQGRYKEAVQEWQEALRLSPGNVGFQKKLAEALYFSRDFNAAESVLADLVKREPESARLHFLYGDVLLQSQQMDRAISFLREAVRLDPKLLTAHASLGRAYVQMGKGAEAIPHLRKALPTDQDGSIHYQLARAYQRAGQADLAGQALKRYQEIQAAAEAERQKLEQQIQIVAP